MGPTKYEINRNMRPKYVGNDCSMWKIGGLHSGPVLLSSGFID